MNIKYPTLKGLELAKKKRNDVYKKEPSDELVKIIEESTNNYELDDVEKEQSTFELCKLFAERIIELENDLYGEDLPYYFRNPITKKAIKFLNKNDKDYE